MKAMKKAQGERRLYKRYMAKNNFFVVHSGNIGKIRNISMGGFNCSCLFNPYLPEGKTKFDLFCLNDQLLLKNIPFKKIFTKLDYETTFSMLLTRECGVELSKLSTSEKSKLKYLIPHHTDMESQYSFFQFFTFSPPVFMQKEFNSLQSSFYPLSVRKETVLY